ncbi:unnamed protein product [Paramecium primaurelia]|uniref:Uncharacterized protein n=1 Tax=Paramecium primaurelia TaxID=5886 RepID=A0A8S1PED1_PARPR|nr:unnamed protein product [Paramecium primaurelia]
MAINQDPNQKHYYVNKTTTLSDVKLYDNALKEIQFALKIDSQYHDVNQAFNINHLHQQGDIYINICQSKQYEKVEKACDQVLILDSQNQYVLNCQQEIPKKISKQQPQVSQVQISVQYQLKEVASRITENLSFESHKFSFGKRPQIYEHQNEKLKYILNKNNKQVVKQHWIKFLPFNRMIQIHQNKA